MRDSERWLIQFIQLFQQFWAFLNVQIFDRVRRIPNLLDDVLLKITRVQRSLDYGYRLSRQASATIF